jgi:ABC-type uncharacterized transport system ATPase subunit
LAVDNICVGIAQQECFGLLGQNGEIQLKIAIEKTVFPVQP